MKPHPTKLAACLTVALLATPAASVDLGSVLPQSAVQTIEAEAVYTDRALAVGPWAEDNLQSVLLKGRVTDAAWRLPEQGHSTFDLNERLSRGLADQGFIAIFACQTDGCGGFDFRYAIRLLPEPQMHVDLGDFRYTAFVRGRGEDADYAALMVSRSGTVGYVQLTTVISAVAPEPPTPPAQEPVAAGGTLQTAPPATPQAMDSLETQGHVVLSDLAFASGSAELGEGPFASLTALAAYLADHPDRNVLIVGHTDDSGTLDGNIALSRQRAQSVVARLTKDHGVDAARISAQGVGSLSPMATNMTDQGRRKNRRVEAVLTSTR
jgi:OOP family OmpA-OmpF porin